MSMYDVPSDCGLWGVMWYESYFFYYTCGPDRWCGAFVRTTRLLLSLPPPPSRCRGGGGGGARWWRPRTEEGLRTGRRERPGRLDDPDPGTAPTERPRRRPSQDRLRVPLDVEPVAAVAEPDRRRPAPEHAREGEEEERVVEGHVGHGHPLGNGRIASRWRRRGRGRGRRGRRRRRRGVAESDDRSVAAVVAVDAQHRVWVLPEWRGRRRPGGSCRLPGGGGGGGVAPRSAALRRRPGL